MYEILFRGKRKDTLEWVEGYLFKYLDKTYILWDTTNDIHNMFEVFPESVGQYTGLTDKNSKKIWSGSIVKIKEDIYICTWNEYNFEYEFRNRKENIGIAYVSRNCIEEIGKVYDIIQIK